MIFSPQAPTTRGSWTARTGWSSADFSGPQWSPTDATTPSKVTQLQPSSKPGHEPIDSEPGLNGLRPESSGPTTESIWSARHEARPNDLDPSDAPAHNHRRPTNPPSIMERPRTARIWSPRWGVRDVADAGFVVRRGRVIWSVSVTQTMWLTTPSKAACS
jgi:hypothetical protein